MSWPTLLIGNGASIQVSSRFQYQQLFQAAALPGPVRNVFTQLGTENFERVLTGLWEARTVLDALGSYPRTTSKLDRLYLNVKTTLFEAVRTVHPTWTQTSDASLGAISAAMEETERVFTLNYDLLTYWAYMNFGQRQIIDFFWNSPGYTFNINDASPRSGQIPIYNLHGGLHLWQDSATKETGKWTHQGGNDPIIDSLDRYYQGQPSRQPLFVSEGSPEHKLRTIRGSDYLSFALNTLATDDDNIVVFGSSLSAPDAHIVQAINKTVNNTSKNIAISVHPSTPSASIQAFGASMAANFQQHTMYLFDATTHPLGQ